MLCTAFLALPLAACSTTPDPTPVGTLLGTYTVSGGPPSSSGGAMLDHKPQSGVVVTVRNTTSGGTTTLTTGSDGTYRAELPVGLYHVTSYPWTCGDRDIKITAGQTARADCNASVA
jgi:hypothetical protein